MKRLFTGIASVLAILGATANISSAKNSTPAAQSGQVSTQQIITQFVDSQITNGPLKGAVVGVCVMDMHGVELAAYNSSTRMVPASNLKLVTTGAALHAFGPEYKFKTQLAYSGSIDEDGTLYGNVYIIGGGDPTIAAPDSTAYKADALFWKWKNLLSVAGIKRIEGDIIGDGSAYEGYLEHPGWDYADTWTYYGAGTSALCFYENTIDLEVSAGSTPGAPVNMRQAYPETPWMTIHNSAVTGPAGTGNKLYMQTSEFSSTAVLTGTYAIDRRPRREQAANKHGALTCAHEFYKNLKATGWDVTGTYREDIPNQATEENKTLIGATLSPSLSQICRKVNYDSDNFYAEAIYRAMGEAATGISVYDSCLVAINEVLEDLVTKTDGIIQKDGSGLARSNSISPEWMARYLSAMSGNQAFLASIPHPGEGTLYNLKNLLSSKFRIKSGSMGGTLCYSGYVLDQDGKPVRSFAIFTNNLGARHSQVRPALESLIQLIGKN